MRLFLGILVVHVIAFHVGDHFEREFVVVAEEEAPLAGVGNRRRLLQNFRDRLAVLEFHPHEHPRHERKMKCHVELIAIAEVRQQICRPLVRFCQQHASRKFFIQAGPQVLKYAVGLGKIFAVGAFAFDQIRDCIQPETVHAQVQPEAHDVPHLFADLRIVVVQIRLMTEKSVPVVLLRNRVPRPVRKLGIQEDDSGSFVLRIGIAPDVPIPARVLARAA